MNEELKKNLARDWFKILQDMICLEIEKIEIDKYYGSIEDRTLMVVHNEKVLHPLQPYLKEAMSNQISFFHLL